MKNITPQEYRKRGVDHPVALQGKAILKCIARVSVKPNRVKMTPGAWICVEFPLDFIRKLKLLPGMSLPTPLDQDDFFRIMAKGKLKPKRMQH